MIHDTFIDSILLTPFANRLFRFRTSNFLIICTVLFCIGLFPSSPAAAPVKVEVKKHGAGQWELLVDGKPYFIKGVVYNFTVVGDDPNTATQRDWSVLDLNRNGRNDLVYDSWVDKNFNNVQDIDEPAVGDWQLLKDMGVNTIRVYQMPSRDERIRDLYNDKNLKLTFDHPPNKEIFRELTERYGIRVIIGHFFGEWTIGSGADWDTGVDYADPQQRRNLLKNIQVMVEEHKDEPYTLLWLLGNENFMPHDHDNAEKNPEAFLTLVNEAARLIHKLDPHHPVALCNWDIDHLEDIARIAPDVDIFGMNSYSYGFTGHYRKIKAVFDRPVLLTEYGYPAYKEDDFTSAIVKNYHQVSWRDIAENRYGASGIGNSIGAVLFTWADQWYLGGTPFVHDNGAWLGVKYTEWFGLTSQGDGKSSPFLRQLKRVYHWYEGWWRRPLR
jgi:beta-glucuronidase